MVIDTTIHVRHAEARDAARLDELARSLSAGSIVGRFMGGVSRDFAIEELRREVRGDRAEFALIVENSRSEIVGAAYTVMLTPEDAEAAFVVRDREQHHGVGTALLAAVVAELRTRGVRTLQADTASGNGAMLALLREAGFPVHERYFNGGVHVTLQIASPPHYSIPI